MRISDWSSDVCSSDLAPLTYLEPPTLTPPMRRFVDGEVRSGRCRPPRDAAGRSTTTLDGAVLVDGDGRILRTLPRAIDCPTVEQLGAGLALSVASCKLLPPGRPYVCLVRASLLFSLA